MKFFSTIADPQIASILHSGGIGVLRTDTLYGIVARADDEAAVERVYAAKGRDVTKSPIVLISAVDQLYDAPAMNETELLKKVWPGKVSVILASCNAPLWLRRGNDSVAYRLPANDELRALVAVTGSLIAPSANPEGQQPAMTIDEARQYFGDRVDFYVDGGRVTDDTPSQLLRITDGAFERLR